MKEFILLRLKAIYSSFPAGHGAGWIGGVKG
jgi:hypothetical protein